MKRQGIKIIVSVSLLLGTISFSHACSTEKITGIEKEVTKDLEPEVREDESVKENKEELHVYLCFGQSNLAGNARIESQDKDGIYDHFVVFQAVDCLALTSKKGKWYKAVPPLVQHHT